MRAGVRGANGAEIDHIEVFGARVEAGPRTAATSCSARAWPTTARLAAPAPAPSWRVLPPTGNCEPGEVWRQESVIGTTFEASFTVDENRRDGVLPHITGAAYVTGEATLIFDDADPLRWGISHARERDGPPEATCRHRRGGNRRASASPTTVRAKGIAVTLIERGGTKPRRLFLRQRRHGRARATSCPWPVPAWCSSGCGGCGIPRARSTSSRA